MEKLSALLDLLSGLGGLKAHMILGPESRKCFRHCLIAVIKVVSLIQEKCPAMIRGDFSALVSSFPELFSAMTAMAALFVPSSAQNLCP